MKRILLKLFLIFNGLQLVFLLVIFIHSEFSTPNFEAKKAIFHRFSLTDYCFSTESRHTRHYLFPELIAPFQDFGGWHEHFPSSSFFNAPAHFSKKNR